MPEQKTLERAEDDKKEGKAPSTQAGEFVREEIEHVREGKHGARSTKQAIAIGLSKARRAGVSLPAPKAGRVSERTRRSAARGSARGRSEPGHEPSPRRSRAVGRRWSGNRSEPRAPPRCRVRGTHPRALAAR